MRPSRRSSALLLAPMLFSAVSMCCFADESVFVSDSVGAARLSSRPTSAEASPFDALNPEEFALASPELLQVVILSRSSTTPEQVEISLIRTFYGDKADTLRRAFVHQAAPALEEGRLPVMLAFRTPSGALVLQPTVSSIGYRSASSIVFRLPSGSTMSYPLRSRASLFACIASGQRAPIECRARRLAAYGVDDRARFETYTRLAREDPAAAALWILVRKREGSARFPARLCSSRVTRDCASYRRFADRLHYQPSS